VTSLPAVMLTFTGIWESSRYQLGEHIYQHVNPVTPYILTGYIEHHGGRAQHLCRYNVHGSASGFIYGFTLIICIRATASILVYKNHIGLIHFMVSPEHGASAGILLVL